MINPFDLLLDSDDDILFTDGDLTIGNSLTQEVGILLRLNQGDLKSDPLLGPNLVRQINGLASHTDLKTSVKVHLARDNKSYDDVKDIISAKTNTL